MMASHPLAAFRPPALSDAAVAALNAAAAHGPAMLPVGAEVMTVSVMPASAPAPGVLCLDLTVGGEAAFLLVPPGLLAAASLPGASPAGANPDAELAALQLEAALAEVLSDLEGQLGIGVAIKALRPWRGEAPRLADSGLADVLGVGVSCGGHAFACLLHAGPFALAKVVAAAPRRRGPVLGHPVPGHPLLDGSMPILACVRAGTSEVRYADLLSLRPGDALLIEDCGLRDGRVLVVVGECWAAGGHQVLGAVQLDSRPGPRGAGFLRRWYMTDGSYDPADADVAELRVTLVFEFGRRMASLAEVAAFGPGSVLETGGGPDQSVDVLANGRRIGRGTVVLVGGAFAVQLHSIHVPGQAAPAPGVPAPHAPAHILAPTPVPTQAKGAAA